MTNNNQQQDTNTKNILDKIKRNELVVKPKIYFRIKFAALIILLAMIALVSIFLSSFIMFSLDVGGRTALMGFGPSGWQVFFSLFPWKIVFVLIVLIFLLEHLFRSFRFGYRIPVIYLFIGVVTLMLLSGLLVEQTPLHSKLLQQADKEHLPPPVSNLYKDTRRPPSRDSGIFSGTVEGSDEVSLIVNLYNPEGTGSTTQVIVDFSNIKEVRGFISAGDRILIKGRLNDGYIKAIQVKKIKPF